MCVSRSFFGSSEFGRRGGHFLSGARVIDSSIFGDVSSARAPRNILTVMGVPRCRVSRLFGNSGARLLILRDVRSPKGLNAVVHANRNTNMDNVVVGHAAISVFGPGAIHSAVNSLCHIPFCVASSLPRAVRCTGSGKISLCTTRLGKGYSCSEPSCAKTYNFVVKGRNGKLSSRVTSVTSACVHVPVRKTIRSLGTTVSTALLVCRYGHREELLKRWCTCLIWSLC